MGGRETEAASVAKKPPAAQGPSQLEAEGETAAESAFPLNPPPTQVA